MKATFCKGMATQRGERGAPERGNRGGGAHHGHVRRGALGGDGDDEQRVGHAVSVESAVTPLLLECAAPATLTSPGRSHAWASRLGRGPYCPSRPARTVHRGH